MNSYNIEILPKYYKRVEPGSMSWEKIPHKRNLSPHIYYNYALTDFTEKKTSRQRVNALSNAKRALHFQVELISNALGILQYYKGKTIDFPHRLDYCRECGITTPNIIRKINKLRNLVEHDYIIPTINQVQDYLDIVELFLTATDRLIYQFPSELEFIYEKKTSKNIPDIADICFPIGEGIVYLHYRPDNVDELHKMEFYKWMKKYSYKIFAKQGPIFFTWVRLLVQEGYNF